MPASHPHGSLLQRIHRRIPILYLLLALPTATLLCFITAPFAAPDEQHHAAHAIAIGHGLWLAHPGPTGEAGSDIDANAMRVMDGFDSIRMAWEAQSADFHNRHYGALTPRQQMTYTDIRWAHSTTFAPYPNTAVYPPTLYLPAVAAWRIAESADLTILQGLRLARLFTAFTAVALGWLALRLCRIPRWPLFAFLLLPSVVFLDASCSQDAILLSIAALIVALLTRPLLCRRNLTLPELALLTLLLAVAATARPPYLAMCLLLFLPASNERAPHHGFLHPLAAFVSVVALAAAWRRLVTSFGFDPSDLANPTSQIRFLQTHPFLAAQALLNGSLTAALDLVHRGLYVIGWNDLLPPAAFSIALVAALAIILFTARTEPILCTRAARILLTLSAITPLLAISLAEYIIWTPPGATTVYGIQPRYWLPILPTATLLLRDVQSAVLRRKALQRPGPAGSWLLLFAICTIAASTLTLPFFAATAFYHMNAATVFRLNLN